MWLLSAICRKLGNPNPWKTGIALFISALSKLRVFSYVFQFSEIEFNFDF